MNKKTTKLFYEYYHRWVLPFVVDRGDNLLESEGQLHLLITSAVEDNWISVEDELPKDTKILVYITDGDYSGVQVAFYSQADYKFTTYGFNKSNVTHWQPLPNPPKE